MANGERKRRSIPVRYAPVRHSPPYLLIRYPLFLRFRGELLALFHRFLDRSDHVESGFRQVVVLAFDQTLEALDGVLQVDELARRAGEDFGDVERLRQEALD